MQPKRRLVVAGAGGLGEVIIWTVQRVNAVSATYDVLGYCDDEHLRRGQLVWGYPVLGTPEDVAQTLPEQPCFICAIGNNARRAQAVPRLLALGWKPASIVDPAALVASGVTIAAGALVAAGASLSPNARVGAHAVVLQGCTIGHEAVLADLAHTAPGARVSGGCRLEEGAYLGSNAVVAPGVRVGRYATLGACSFAVADVPDGATAVGNPARVIVQRGQADAQARSMAKISCLKPSRFSTE